MDKTLQALGLLLALFHSGRTGFVDSVYKMSLRWRLHEYGSDGHVTYNVHLDAGLEFVLADSLFCAFAAVFALN